MIVVAPHRRCPGLWQAGGVAAAGSTPVAAGPSGAGPFAAGPFDRGRALRRLADETFDVLVIGGGITGAGVALDAAARGLRTALVERQDFASGTSSMSSKLVHGGLRYLQQGDVRLVYEALHERQRLLRNAPHLVRPLPFLIPVFGRDGVLASGVARAYEAALLLYDLTGGWRIGRRHRRVDRADVLRHLPTLRTDRLVAGFLYFDAQADDARLTLAVLRTAALDFGAAIANYAEAVSVVHGDDGTAIGAMVRPCAPGDAWGRLATGPPAHAPANPPAHAPASAPAHAPASPPAPSADEPNPGEILVRARVIVNATGVWADDVRALDEGCHPRTTRPAKGIHVTVPADRLPADIAAVVPVQSDRRSIFVVPWPDGRDVYIGTTDTAWDGSIDEPVATPDDVAYLLGAVNAATTTPLAASDVTGVWAGLRPLLAPPPDGEGRPAASQERDAPAVQSEGSPGSGGNGRRVPGRLSHLVRMLRARPPTGDGLGGRTADLSRRHRVFVSPSGVVTITGGKLTTYRLMAEEAVDAAVRRLGHQAPPGARRSPTRDLPLRGAPQPTGRSRRGERAAGNGEQRRPAVVDGAVVDGAVMAALQARHGTEAEAVLAVAEQDPALLEPLVPGLPYLRAEAVWAACQEMAQTADDVLSRRTRATIRDALGASAAAGWVAEVVAQCAGRSAADAAADGRSYTGAVATQLARAGLAPAASSPAASSPAASSPAASSPAASSPAADNTSPAADPHTAGRAGPQRASGAPS